VVRNPAPGFVGYPYIIASHPGPAAISVRRPATDNSGSPDITIIRGVHPHSVLIKVRGVWSEFLRKVPGAGARGVRVLVSIHVPLFPLIGRQESCPLRFPRVFLEEEAFSRLDHLPLPVPLGENLAIHDGNFDITIIRYVSLENRLAACAQR
jgi:hypothetical protein